MVSNLEKTGIFYTFQEKRWHLKTMHWNDTGCISRTTRGSELFRKYIFLTIHSHIFIIKRLQIEGLTCYVHAHLCTVIMY